MTRFLSIICFLFSTICFGQKLSITEQKILNSVEKNNTNAIEFLKEVVNINSGTLNLAGVQEVGKVFDQAFSSINFETKWIPMPEEMNRAGHFFAEKKGSKGKKLLLIGHLDTVFEKDSDFQKFEMINDSTAHAPGGNDMKGGDVIVLYALKALEENGLLDNAQIIVAYTGDEESTGKPLSISRQDLIEAAKRSDIALGFETSSGFNYATVARRGASGWQLNVKGKRAHSSGVFNENVGAGAIYETSRILNEFYQQLSTEKYLTFNPGVIVGGTVAEIDDLTGVAKASGKSNVVSQTTSVKGDLRFISEEQKENARATMRKIVAENYPKTSAEITFSDSYPAMSPSDGNTSLLTKLNQVSLDLNQGAVKAYDPGRRGAADVSFVAKYVDCLDGLGTMGSGAHTPQETVNLNTIEALTKRTAILIYRLINE